MVGGQRGRQGQLLAAIRAEKIQDFLIDQRLEDHAAVRAVRVAAGLRQQSAHHRRDRREALFRVGQRRRHDHHEGLGSAPRGEVLRARDEIDHGGIGFARRFAPSHDAMLHPDQRVASGVRIVGGDHRLGQLESRLHIIDQRHALAQRFANQLFALRLVGQHQDRVGVGMIDVLGGEVGVRKGFNGRRGGIGYEPMHLELARHRVIGKLREGAQPLQILKVEGRVAFRLDGSQIEP